MRTKDFNFDLPDDYIAQTPLDNREESKLMILDKNGEKDIIHEKFKNIINYLKAGDCLVLNDTRVLPARIYGSRVGKKEKIEILLIKEVETDIWEVMVKPGRKARVGHMLEFGEGLKGEIIKINEIGTRLIKFEYEGRFISILEKIGEMPLPPYIKAELKNSERYQTVFSDKLGSAAAPTAGLHFTKSLLQEIEKKGIKIVNVTLHVGLGTFSPVRVEDIKKHKMHSEFYSIDEESAKIINNTKAAGGRIISVGTTSSRVLESVSKSDGTVEAKSGWTDIFIYPGYDFKIVDGLITNFHLPESTLLMLVSALAGRDNILNAYEIAKLEDYRFFSFGDAMFII